MRRLILPILTMLVVANGEKKTCLEDQLRNYDIQHTEYEGIRQEVKKELKSSIQRIKQKYNVQISSYVFVPQMDEEELAEFHADSFLRMNSDNELSYFFEAIKNIENDLGKINPALRFDCREICLRNLCYRSSIVTFTTYFGEVEHWEKDEVSLNQHTYSIANLAHELAHLHEKAVDLDFHRRWNDAVGKRIPSGTGEVWCSPREGFMRGYATKGPCMNHQDDPKSRWHEDIATFVEEAYKENFGNYRVVDPNDHRYNEKLSLLREYDFISSEQHEGILEILGKDFK